jgi:hypothetical protein
VGGGGERKYKKNNFYDMAESRRKLFLKNYCSRFLPSKMYFPLSQIVHESEIWQMGEENEKYGRILKHLHCSVTVY